MPHKDAIQVRLLSWNRAEIAERQSALKSLGYRVNADSVAGAPGVRRIAQDPPGAIVIDLSRQPSVGRDIALGLRMAKSTRRVPLVFVGGDPEKVARIRSHLPDALYTTWGRIGLSLERAIRRPPADPVVPGSIFAPYAGRTLVQKLGVKPESRLALIGAPRDSWIRWGRFRKGSGPSPGCAHPPIWSCGSPARAVRSRTGS